VEVGRRRAKEGAGPVTIAIDISYVGTVLQHVSAVYGYQVPAEQLRPGRRPCPVRRAQRATAGRTPSRREGARLVGKVHSGPPKEGRLDTCPSISMRLL
jgi:hypothetical protein